MWVKALGSIDPLSLNYITNIVNIVYVDLMFVDDGVLVKLLGSVFAFH